MVELVRHIERCDYAHAARHLRRIAQNSDPTTDADPNTTPSGLQARTFRPFRRRIPLDPRVPFLQQRKGISVATAVRFEAGRSDRSAFLRNSVAVRLHDVSGHPLGYCGRRLSDADIARWGKWRLPRGMPKGQILYNAHRARPVRHAGIIVVECPWAVMRLAQAGVAGAVALLGTRLTEQHRAWLAKAPTVLLLLDADLAGRKAVPEITRTLRCCTRVLVHELPDGKEPEDLTDPDLAALAQAHLPFSLNPYSLDPTKVRP